jgi:hypothetical protein
MHSVYIVLFCLLMSFYSTCSQCDAASDSSDSASRSLKRTITPSTSLEKVYKTEKLPSHHSINNIPEEREPLDIFPERKRSCCTRFFAAACRFFTCCCP